jgi:hypothetical protein
MTRSLIVFYSLDGFTEKIAKAIATKIGADLLHLHPKQDIKKSGLKFMKYFWRRKTGTYERDSWASPIYLWYFYIWYYLYRNSCSSLYLYASH